MNVSIGESDDDLRKCFSVFRQLRPHLNEPAFLDQVRRQIRNHGYSRVYIEEHGSVKSAAGYRIAEFLAWGKTLYVDDLITEETDRGKGYGGRLMDWLVDQAKALGCAEIHLDSGVNRFDAHRLYLNKRMIISSHHFSRTLK